MEVSDLVALSVIFNVFSLVFLHFYIEVNISTLKSFLPSFHLSNPIFEAIKCRRDTTARRFTRPCACSIHKQEHYSQCNYFDH